MVMGTIDFEQLLAETKSKLRRLVEARSMIITPGSMDVLLNVVESTIRTWRTEMELAVPRKSKSLNAIHCIGDKTIGYHYVDGVRRQIAQIKIGNKIHYYTDGIKENV
jgi:hypothetical protein